MGYHLAGYTVTGVDLEPQPNYPFEFIRGCAFEYAREHGHKFDIIHASPPCQKYSRATAPHRAKGKTYPDLIAKTRNLLDELGKPYIIENVACAPIRADITLYGYMFGLKVIRKRLFELGGGLFLMQPAFPTRVGSVRSGDFVSVFGKGSYRKSTGDAYPKFLKESVRETWAYAMGIDADWMTDVEMGQAIPPAYTRYIGQEIMQQVA